MSYISISPNAALGLPLDVANPLEIVGAVEHSLVVGGAAGELVSLGVAGDGEIPIGVAGGDPVLTTITAGANVNVVSGPGTITISSVGANEFADNVFRVYDALDITSKLAFDVNPVAPATTRTIVMCDQDLDLTDPDFPGHVTAATGFTATSSNVEVLAGNVNLPSTYATLLGGVININAVPYFHAAGTDSVFVGPDAGNGTNTGSESVGVGFRALEDLTLGNLNVAVGSEALSSLTSGSENVAVGRDSLDGISTGNRNIAVGSDAGSNLTAGNSNNILIGNTGFAGENNALRIGTTGGGAGQQNACYIAGTYGVTPVGALQSVVINANGQIGSSVGPVSSEFADNVFRIYDNGTITKKLAFECSGITAATTRTITMDDRDIDMDAVPTTVVSDAGNCTPAAGSFSIVGAGGITTSAAGSIVTVTGGGGIGITWSEVTGVSQAAAVNNGYICNNAGLVTVTLPDTAALGSFLRVVGKGAGGWAIAQNAGETIYWDETTATTTGVGGSLSSTDDYDAVELVCITADTDWMVLSAKGNIGVT